MNFLLQFCIIYSFIIWARSEPILGINVRDTTENEFPFVVAIGDVDDDVKPEKLYLRQFCTGSLISRKHVLTAEHCLAEKAVKRVEILVGCTNLDVCKAYKPKKWMTWQQWKYNDTKKFPLCQYDVAVITLKKCITEANTQPAIVPKFKPQDVFGKSVQMAGCGLTNDNIKPETFRTVQLNIISNADCESSVFQILKTHIHVADRFLCASSKPWALNECGDSGGPLIHKGDEVIGITLGTCPEVATISEKYHGQVIDGLLEERVNVYASLHFYRDFISHFTRKNQRCGIV